MRYIRFLILLLGVTCLKAQAGAPDQISLKRALQDMERSYHVKFNYDEDILRNKLVDSSFNKEQDLDRQLRSLLEPYDLDFEAVDKDSYVILLKSKDGFQNTGEQVIAISGTVKDPSGFELPGVTVLEQGTTNGTITDVDGSYTLKADENAVLDFSFVGYKKHSEEVAGRTRIDVVLEVDVQSLDEVVVIGYGSVKKSDLTGSLSSISGEEITKVATSSLDQALQGRAAGVQVRQVTGRPGGETSIRIRGTSSITAGNEPLYVIDGMMVTSNSASTSAGGNRGPALNPLASINPSDIESIEVLKDASATAIYGSRGSNGVVLITTKKGRSGQSSINFESYYGIQQVRKKLNLLNGVQFATLINEVNLDKGFPLDPKYLVPEEFGEGTDWQDVIFRDAPIQSYQLNFSGGEQKTNYMVSAGYFAQDGIIVGSDFKRLNFRTNLNREVNERIDIGTNLGVSRMTSRGVLTNNGTLLPGVSMTALLFPPTQPVLDPNVRGGYTYQDNRGRNLANPYADAMEVQDNSTSLRLIGTAFATYEILNNLTYKINLGFDAFSSKENRFVPNFLKRTEANNGEAVVATINGSNWLLEHTISYRKTFGEHRFDGVAGFTAQQFMSERLWSAVLDFPDNKTGYHAIQNGINPQPSTTSRDEWGMLSYLGRINYAYQDKYFFTATARVDGSSRFGVNNKYGIFPSGSFAWRVSDETFWPENKVLSNLKTRVSYGVIGNSEIGNYGSLSTVAVVGQGTFNNDEPYNGLAPVRYANPDLRWERANQFDLGLDIEVMEGRLSSTIDYYYRLTSDLLLNNEIPTTTGFSQSLTNVGSVVNKGFEFTLNSINLEGDLRWTTSLNFSVNRNRVASLATDNDVLISGALFLPTGWSILREGEPIGTFYGYQTDGIFQSDEEVAEGPLLSAQAIGNTAKPGDRRYKDTNSRDASGNLTGQPDGIINEADRVIMGQANPDFSWGFNNSFSYKGFDLSFFIQGVYGNEVVNVNLFEISYLNGETNVLEEYYVNAWSENNPNQQYPRINPDRNSKNVFSDAYVEDGSFARLQNLTFGYSFSPTFLTRLKMQKLRIYVSGNNLFTLTKYSGYDPEVNAFGTSTLYQGADYGGYPTARSFITGLQLTF